MRLKTNYLIDAVIFAALLVALEPRLTGIAIHEWFSAAFAGTIIAHILMHWKWITGVMGKFFARLWHKSRLQFIVDTLLFIAFTAVMMSGLMISKSILPTLGLSAIHNQSFRMLHSLSANASLLLAGVHFALNWNWVVDTTRRLVIQPLRSLGLKRPQPAPALAEVGPAVQR